MKIVTKLTICKTTHCSVHCESIEHENVQHICFTSSKITVQVVHVKNCSKKIFRPKIKVIRIITLKNVRIWPRN